jgi:NAD(P)-dependent dehydrogenase (short-subunit alcohol dehydrogenase family)
MKKIALITGTSSGIGYSAAIAMAQAGYRVIATMRNLDKAQSLRQLASAQDLPIEIRQMDVQDQASVTRCVAGIIADHGRIDVLLNNAGSGYLGTMEETRFADLERVMDANFYGAWRVTQAVFPHMRTARSGHVLSVSSVGGLLGQPFNDAYCAAKFALEGFMESLAPLAKRFGVHVSLIEPGPVNTEFVTSVKSQISARPNAHPEYQVLRESYLAGTAAAFANAGQTPDQVAQCILASVQSAAPHLRYPTSALIRDVISKKYTDPTGDTILKITGARLPD